MFDIIVRAAHKQPLTPAERASLKAVQGLIFGAVGTGLTVLVTALVAGKQIDTALLVGALMTAFYTLLSALSKYVAAQGDTAVANLINAGAEVAHEKIDPIVPQQQQPQAVETK